MRAQLASLWRADVLGPVAILAAILIATAGWGGPSGSINAIGVAFGVAWGALLSAKWGPAEARPRSGREVLRRFALGLPFSVLIYFVTIYVFDRWSPVLWLPQFDYAPDVFWVAFPTAFGVAAVVATLRQIELAREHDQSPKSPSDGTPRT